MRRPSHGEDDVRPYVMDQRRDVEPPRHVREVLPLIGVGAESVLVGAVVGVRMGRLDAEVTFTSPHRQSLLHPSWGVLLGRYALHGLGRRVAPAFGVPVLRTRRGCSTGGTEDDQDVP